jgi:hypothetical protein
MYPLIKTAIRFSMTATLIFGLAASAFAGAKRLHVVLNCDHEDLMEDIPVSTLYPEIESNETIPVLFLEIAGAGFASQMCGPVVCVSRDYYIAFDSETTGKGSATFRLRDRTGEVIVMSAEISLSHAPGHFAGFTGKYKIDPKLSTGRFAGATGCGKITGWADNDGEPFSGGQGYAEMTGTLILAQKPLCKGKK